MIGRVRWEAYKRKTLWRYVGWRKTVFTDLIVNSILYLGYCGEATSLTLMARDLECHHSHLRQEIINLLQKTGCVKIIPYKSSKKIVLTEQGWRVFVLMEALHIVLNKGISDLNISDKIENGEKV
jgi:hypothetical protein